jgi:hypothetical protein
MVPRAPMKPGLSRLSIRSITGWKSASKGMPLTSTIFGVAHVDHAGEGAPALAGEDYWPSSDCSRCELVFNVVMRPSGLFQQPVKVRINGFRLNLFRHQVERIG